MWCEKRLSKSCMPREQGMPEICIDALAVLRATGKGWQTRVNALLREAVGSGRLGV
jgi:uncharacterized protein (DUF4415 family)